MAGIGNWTFTPLAESFPSTILPNLGWWNASNGTWAYQIQVAWPLNWTSRDAAGLVETLYVLDGNALSLTATEAIRRRRPVDSSQPDTIIVSIGYPTQLPDSPYSSSRSYDLQIPVCANCTAPEFPGVPSNADNFITFLDTVLRPWIRGTVFPNTEFSRDALYGHSFAGLFVLYVLLVRPELFDTLLSASPSLWWADGYIFTQLGNLFGSSEEMAWRNVTSKPAFQISYGGLEQDQVRRRIETDEEWASRQELARMFNMEDNCKKLYQFFKGSDAVRDVVLHEYPFSDHAAVGGAALADGLDYFLDWPPRIAGT
ncbi:hypothetical protein DM02DRAFT_601579 [Periconia macrospinosa]|uniref:Siderophore esteras-like protein IroE-like protein n=1 Tax=Periconia macrospinosa TaxID=97972 RepID=A0A2V1DBR3_9PLEO|nr:hypothetical protein DM02DRAFT_601579 [Periconia macrospinosa]